MPFGLDARGAIEEGQAESISHALEQQPRLWALAQCGDHAALRALRCNALGVAQLVTANEYLSGFRTTRTA